MRRRNPSISWTVLLTAIFLMGSPHGVGALPAPPQEGPQGGVMPADVPVFGRRDADMVLTLDQTTAAALEGSFEFYRLQQRYLQLAYGLEAAQRSLRMHVEFNSLLPSVTQGFTNLLYNDFGGTLALDLFEDEILHVRAGVSVIKPLITNGRITFNTRLTGYQRSMLVANAAPGSPRAELRYVLPQFSLQFNQPLFQYNEVKGRLREAQLDLESLELSYGEVEVARVNGITRAFYDLLRAQRLMELAAEHHRQSRLNYEVGSRRFDLGMISEMDRLGLQVTMVNSRDRLLQAQSEHERSQLDFDRAVGIPVAERVWVDAEESWSGNQIDLQRALDTALANRSDVRQRQIALEQTRLKLQEVVSYGRPDLQLNVSYDYTGNSTVPGFGIADGWGTHFGAAFDPANMGPNANVNLQLRVPILDGRENQSRVLQRQSEVRVRERETDEAGQDLERDVRESVQGLTRARERVEMQSANRELARLGYEATRARYETGEADLSDLLLAQQRHHETEALFVEALIAHKLAWTALEEVTMWDWERDVPLAIRTAPPRPFERDGSDR